MQVDVESGLEIWLESRRELSQKIVERRFISAVVF
jgi:hypothetical protein